MNRSLLSTLLLLMIVITGCNTTSKYSSSSPLTTNQLLIDDIYLDYQLIPIESEQEIFAIDSEMAELANSKLKPIDNIKKRSIRLIEHLFEEENIGLAYKSNANYTARQTFRAKSANCMSLTILAYVLAKESDLNVVFQEVEVPEYWVRNGEYNMLTGHVNLKVIKPKARNSIYLWGSNELEIDFDPNISKKKFSKRTISKNTVLAMFYNNKGANALANNEGKVAYRYFKEAIQYNPKYSAVWSNLAILYRQSGELDLAEKTYKHAISLKSDNLTALNNLSYLYRFQGKHDSAHEIEKLIHNKRRKNPYYHALLADEAFTRKNYELALKYFKSAIKLSSNEHLFYFGLAKSYFMLEKYEHSEKAMLKAISIAKAPDINNSYLAKLNIIKNQTSFSK